MQYAEQLTDHLYDEVLKELTSKLENNGLFISKIPSTQSIFVNQSQISINLSGSKVVLRNHFSVPGKVIKNFDLADPDAFDRIVEFVLSWEGS